MYTRIEASGVENVPLSGPLVIASNHLNDADPGIICTRIPRPIAFMAKIELFQIPLLKQFLIGFGAFSVKRGEADLGALRRANEELGLGRAVCIFPEGTREGVKEQLTEAWPGAALIALRNDVPVLPIAITGSGSMSIPKMFLRLDRRLKVTLTIGEPFHLEKPARLNAEAAKDGTRQIMERIAALLPERARGYYGYGSSGDLASSSDTDAPEQGGT
ncbi:MAG TPA: lysophospholipid acyltransferase family protein [Dehalococcoidia bacterium]|nr:lysophospholipid acyltransferase family protein [Dehalococcoidia bacterium]